jgi:hypothetical protein
MSLSFQITRFALLALVVLSLAAWGQRTFLSDENTAGGAALPADGLVVINFHAATRCNACQEIGTEAQAVVERTFSDDLKSGAMHWRVINFEEPANKHFIQDYGLTTSTVVIVRREAGRDIDWRRLDAVWDHLFEGPSMRAYLQKQITALNPS